MLQIHCIETGGASRNVRCGRLCCFLPLFTYFVVCEAVRPSPTPLYQTSLEDHFLHAISEMSSIIERSSADVSGTGDREPPQLALVLAAPILMGLVTVFFWWITGGNPRDRETFTQHAFQEVQLEKEFERKTAETQLRSGARVLLLLNIMLWIKRSLQALDENQCVGKMRLSGHGTVVRAVFTSLSVVCIWKPSSGLFYLILFQNAIYILWSFLPPFDLTCPELIDFQRQCPEIKVWKLRADRLDCSLQGHTSIQICVFFMLLIPWLIQKSKLLFLPWLWLVLFYIGLSIIIRFTIPGFQHWESEIASSSILIAVAIAISSRKMISQESTRRKIFLTDQRLHTATKKLYSILDVMLPAHVIVPMLKNPGDVIAEEVETASILFIVIVDFDKFASQQSPDELLSFLNKYFTQFDGICADQKVTKIETVCEEYVACVGVTPDDRDTQAMMGHSHILERLFKAAGQILQLQSEEVSFKMGLHTGPIVAGVIGSKLPRYRLFGDTINTAARMMQKGQSGALQFGEETYSKMPRNISAKYRGEVEMKGKGAVRAYLFDGLPPGDGSQVTVHEMSGSPGGTNGGPQGLQKLHRTTGKKNTGKMKIINMLRNLPEMIKDHRQSANMKDNVTSDNRDSQPAEDHFEFVMSQIAPEKHEQRGFFGMRIRFTPKLEEKWQSRFHEHVVCGHLALRINTLMLVFVVLTTADLSYMLWIKSWERPHEFYSSSYRIPIVILTRSICFFYLVVWRAISMYRAFLHSKPRFIQAAIVVSTAIICLLMYVSYDAIAIMSKKMARNEVNKIAYLNEQYSLIYTLVFFLIISQIRCTFLESLWFVPLAMIIMALRNWTHLYISDQGRWIFITTALVRSVLALEAEYNDRRRFQTNENVEQMQGRLENILNSMMPPLVLKQLQYRSADDSSSLPSDTYLNATIAQSDLAGFTKLASTRKPSEVVEFVGDLFGRFDALTDTYKVYKVETIGDAYIAGCGAQPLTNVDSPANVVLFGLQMIIATRRWASERGFDVLCRVGVHRGPCIGGIVGTDMQRYHLFGQLIGLVDTLEATSLVGRVQVSKAVKDAVEEELKQRGQSLEEVFGGFEPREGDSLTTSKGELHDFDEVGGRTFLVKEPPSTF